MTHYSHKPDFSRWTAIPPAPAAPPPSSLRRLLWNGLFWVALIPLLAQSLLPSLFPTPQGADTGEALAMRQVELEFQARVLIAVRDLAQTGAAGADSAILTRLADGSALEPFVEAEETELLRQTLIVAGHVGLRDLARQVDERLTTRSVSRAEDYQAANAQLAALYLADPPEALDDGLASDLVERYGWVGRLLEADQAAVADGDRGAALAAVIGAESRTALVRISIVTLGVLALFLVGVLSLPLFVHGLYAGWLRLRGPGTALAPRTAFEAFTLYLMINALFMVLSDRGGDWSALFSVLALAWLAGSPILLLWPIWRGQSRHATLRAAGLYGAGRMGRETAWGVLGYAAMIPLLPVASLVSSQIAGALGQSLAEGAHPLAPLLIQSPSVAQIVFMALLAVVIAPITEEIFFRGFLYYWLRSRAGATFSIATSALLFAALHPQGVIGVPLLFTLGAGFAFLREWRGSLVAPVVAHACVNGVTTAILLAL